MCARARRRERRRAFAVSSTTARRDAERRGAKRVERVEMATGAGATRVVLQRNAAADRGDLKSKFGGRPARVSRRRGGGG